MRRMMAMAVVAALMLTATAVGWRGDASIQGTWKMTAVNFGGKEIPVPEGKGITVKFAAGGKVSVDEGSGKLQEGTYKVDDTKKPRQLDLNIKKGDKDEKTEAIYEITGDMLKVGFAADKGSRPTSFDGAQTGVLIFKRDKDKK
jgi:uncharacterized protein (TIGR03067 family)